MNMDQSILSEAVIRREVLEQFAKMTPHKPAALDAQFYCGLVMPTKPRKGDAFRIEATFGGRSASRPIPGDTLKWPMDRFSAEIAKPLAHDLMASKRKHV